MAEQPLVVTVYGRPGCGLCDQALVFLGTIGHKVPLTVHVVDIEQDDGLLRRYMFEIPVVEVNGQEIARAPIYETRLEDALMELAGLA